MSSKDSTRGLSLWTCLHNSFCLSSKNLAKLSKMSENVMPISEIWRSFAKIANDRKCTTLRVFVASYPVSPTMRLGTLWMIRCKLSVETYQISIVRQVVRIHANLLHFRYLFSEIDWNNHNPFSFLKFPVSCLQKRLDLSSENSGKILKNVRKCDADFRKLTELFADCGWTEVNNSERVCGFLPGQSHNASGDDMNAIWSSLWGFRQ